MGWLLVTRQVHIDASRDPAAAQPPIRRLHHPKGVSRVCFSPGGKMLVTGGGDGVVRVWDTGTWRVTHSLMIDRQDADAAGEDRVDGLVFSADGQILAAGSEMGDVSLWETSTWKMRGHLADTHESYLLAFSPDGAKVATASGTDSVRLWNAATCRRLRGFRWPYRTNWNVFEGGFSADGKLLAGAVEDGTVRLWDVASGRLSRTLRVSPGMGDIGCAAAFTRDGALIAGGTYDQDLKVWRTSTGRLLWRLKEANWVDTLVFSPNGKWLAIGIRRDNDSGTIRLRSSLSGKAAASFPDAGIAYSIAFSPDGRLLAVTGSDNVCLWELPARFR
jgi:WD40 repeat protein